MAPETIDREFLKVLFAKKIDLKVLKMPRHYKVSLLYDRSAHCQCYNLCVKLLQFPEAARMSKHE
jgi:hypothetical protein